MISTRCILTCTMLGLSTFSMAQIVECVDANGKKIYSQACPAGAEKQRDIEVPAPPPPAKPDASNDAARKALDEKEKAFARRRDERIKAESKDEEQQNKNIQAAQLCESAKRRLEVLESGRQFKRADPETGEHVPMEEEQRQAEIARLHAQIEVSCK